MAENVSADQVVAVPVPAEAVPETVAVNTVPIAFDAAPKDVHEVLPW
jgi:hypothetical protein